MSQRNHRPDGRDDDHGEKYELGHDARPLALHEAIAQEAKSPQAHRSFGIKQQLTIRTSAA